MGTPQRRSCDEQQRVRLEMNPGIIQRADLPGNNLISLTDAHHGIGRAGHNAIPEVPRFIPLLNACNPAQLHTYGLQQLHCPMGRGASVSFLPRFSQLISFQPRLQLQNTHHPPVQRTDNSYSDIVPMPVSNQELLSSHQPALLPDPPAPLPNQPYKLLAQTVPLPKQPSSLPDPPPPCSQSSDLSLSGLFTTKNIAGLEESYPDLVFAMRWSEKREYLEISQQDTQQVAGVGCMSPVRALFFYSDSNNVTYDVQALFSSVQAGTIESLDNARPVINMVSQNASYKFCPGLEYQHYFDFYVKVIRFHISTVRLWQRPFQRVDSIHCILLHQLAHNATMEEKSQYVVLCKQCKRLRALLNHQQNRSSKVDPSTKLQRQQPSSNYKLKHLSPASAQKRKKATQRERSADKAKLAKYEHLDVTLDDDQNDELNAVIEKIEEQHNDELGKVFQEGEAKSKHIGNSMRNIWQSDRCAQTTFLKDQLRNSKGNATVLYFNYNNCLYHSEPQEG